MAIGRPVPTFQEASVAKAAIQARVDDLSAKLKRFPQSGPLRLTPDAVKASPEFRATRAAFDEAFSDLRTINGLMAKLFRSEIAAERRQRRAAFHADAAKAECR